MNLFVTQNDSGMTAFKYVSKVLKAAPTSFIHKLFRQKDVKINGKRAYEETVLNTNDELYIYIKEDLYNSFIQKKDEEMFNDIASMVVYEDDNILIVNKPRGLLVQKDKSGDIALDDMVRSYLKNDESQFNPGPVHRLDRNTGGLVIFAKTYIAAREMSALLTNKEVVNKHYIALVKGSLTGQGKIDASLIKDKNNHVYISKEDDAKEAVTLYKCIKNNNDYSLLDVMLLNGRTHQIRAHLSYIGHPIIGDNKYGDFKLNKLIEEQYHFTNQFLFANTIVFKDISGYFSYLCNKTISVKLNKEMEDLLDVLLSK